MNKYDQDKIQAIMTNLGVSRQEAEAMYAKTSETPNTAYDGNPLEYEAAALKRMEQKQSKEEDPSVMDMIQDAMFSPDSNKEEESSLDKFIRFMGILDEDDEITAQNDLLDEYGGLEDLQDTYSQDVPEAEPVETEEEKYQRQIDTLNGMRNHVTDESYGQDPESLQTQEEQEGLQRTIEALQRQAFERGQGGDASGIPLAQNAGIQGAQDVYQQQVSQPQMNALTQAGPANQLGGQVNPGAGAIGQMSPEIMQALQKQALSQNIHPLAGIGGGNPGVGGGNPYIGGY
jgi:hypothetical protein